MARWDQIGCTASAAIAAREGSEAVIYARFSSENQREASIGDQVRNAKRLIEERGWHLVDLH
jgi:hypothetical protein